MTCLKGTKLVAGNQAVSKPQKDGSSNANSQVRKGGLPPLAFHES